MNTPEIKIVHECIAAFGDGFWTEKAEANDETVSNIHLFDDILAYINAAGYDLQLIKVE